MNLIDFFCRARWCCLRSGIKIKIFAWKVRFVLRPSFATASLDWLWRRRFLASSCSVNLSKQTRAPPPKLETEKKKHQTHIKARVCGHRDWVDFSAIHKKPAKRVESRDCQHDGECLTKVLKSIWTRMLIFSCLIILWDIGRKGYRRYRKNKSSQRPQSGLEINMHGNRHTFLNLLRFQMIPFEHEI